MRQYTVALRGSSAATFEEEQRIVVEEKSPLGGPLRLEMRSRWLTLGEGKKLPGHFWVEATGRAATIEEAVTHFSRAAIAFAPVVSLAANAAIGNCDFELAFDSSDGVEERDFVQNHLPGESSALRQGRRIDPPATIALMEALSRSEHRVRALRAASQYWLALQSWRFGHETMAVAHLWMAVEALTKAFVRAEVKRRNLSDESALRLALGAKNGRELDAIIRREVILGGNEECYRNGKDASGGLEHGFLDFDLIRTKAADVRPSLAALVRNSIFNLVDVAPAAHDVLCKAPYGKPLGNWPLTRVLRGKLLGGGTELAAAGQTYPFVEWSVSLNKAEPIGGGQVSAQVSDTMTARLGPGISFRPVRHEVWGQ